MENNNFQQTKYSPDDLPVDLYLELPEPSGSRNNISILFIVIGIIIGLVGGYFMISGPETVYYDPVAGMTFTQFLQAYPGPIATLGVACFGIGNAIAKSGHQKLVSELDKQLSEKLDFNEDDLPAGKMLDIQPLEDGQYRVSSIDIPEKSEQKSW
ncbi:hypothetical protein [Kangiella shandongensis]|uniref:hypothetical protein n=1 Tax=Kangiella shandongensis TaxID=2763258 RepID=UPI001CBAD971|nr:hypothetical protein [Kangiella shandongensis]